MFKGITDVFFDLDHTLWDFEHNSKLTFERILTENSVRVPITEFLKVYVPLNREYWKLYREERITKERLRYERLKVTFDELGHTIDDNTIYALADAYIKVLSTFRHTLPNAMSILNYLRPKYRLHIITNGFHEIQGNKLKNSGIDDFFQVVMDSEQAGVKKPNPKIFELALASANVSPENSVMIGDDLEADVLGARSVGMHAIHYNQFKKENQDFSITISDLNEIKDFL
ncbi:YjjG family noncanonical pyrimidine nucleotidase [Croceivirga thetidis]|uniref:Noncanonical pyrimidine nucleotidase, YjjG family n=1 Tax=Croceivirga thetidis TaxID=2721623 RepID=A0ABX1GW61_9FLAO|nr:YjjG family noncanonical pyrimidine nucleotidase [Croceivirga thetidis]NKI33246.1 noncanonical pyrimidine nucleotidase, YjjG family [Croceivirga thetidis]